MLKIIFSLMLLALSISTFACWKMEGDFSVDGETWKIDQKVEHDKNYSIPMNTFIFNFQVASKKDNGQVIKYLVHEKRGSKLVIVTEGSEDLKVGVKSEIYAKGKEGQPNSIIQVKLTEI